MDHTAELLCIYGWRWLLLLQLFVVGRPAPLFKADVVQEMAVCWAWLWHTAAHDTGVHSKAGQRWPAGAGVSCLAGEEHPC